MVLLQAKGIEKQYGVRTVLDFEEFLIYEGDRIGVVGGNGAGKTTLLRILSGELRPDKGTVTRRCEAAFIRQLPKMEGTLSGGEKTKAMIREETLRNDTVIFADEPTANLDREGIAWVRGKLLAARTVVLVSHDRELLNDVCNRIAEVKDGKVRFFTGSYEDYVQKLEEEKQRQELEYRKNQQERQSLAAAIQGKEQHVARQRQKKRREYATNLSEARLGGHKRAASMKKQEKERKVLEHRLERLPEVARVKDLPKITLDFSLTEPPGNKLVIQCEKLRFSYGERVIFSDASFVVRNGAKVGITGGNGAGKTTLLNLIHTGCDAIRTAPKLNPGFLRQSFEDLDESATVLENVLATSIQDHASARSVLAGLLFRRDDVHKPVAVLSGGEKMRLSLARLITGNYNALLLDEPTNYLDIPSLEAVERVLREYPGTLLFVTHDQRFLRNLGAEELRVEGGKVNPVAKEKPPSPAEKTVLELRRVRLLGEISSAPLEQKTALEAEYAQVVEALRRMSS